MLLAYGKNLAMTGEKKYQLNLGLLSDKTHIYPCTWQATS
jgi:hypothetical protein